MGGGGKSSTSTQTVSIPPEVLARYNAVNARAESVAQQPFQAYGGEFVAPLNPTQVAGIQATSAASQLAQPYYAQATQGLQTAQQGGANYIGAATNQLLNAQQQAQPYLGGATAAALAGGQAVDPGALRIGRYMNPFTQSVVGATQAAMGQQQGQQLAQQQAESIRAGAFGGERAGLQRQTLRGQQGLAQAQAIAPLYQQGYQQALQTAQQQQGVGLAAQQANRAAIQQMGQQLAGLGQQQFGLGQNVSQGLAGLGQQGYTMGAGAAQQLAGLGTGAQQAALQGAQAQIGAGTLAQQTQQAQNTAQYQQFLQERGYPFQVAQFLANIAMGTGALSGSTTSTTQPRGFFSNRGGFKTGESLQRSGKAYGGGLDPNSMGGAVYEPGAFERGGYATSGAVVDPNDLAAILAQQRQSFGPFAAAGPYGQAAGAAPHGPSGIVPQQQLATPKLVTAGALPKQPSGGSDISKGYSLLDEASKGLTGKGVTQRIGEKAFGKDPTAAVKDDAGNILKAAQPAEKGFVQEGWDKLFGAATGGGIMPRHHYADGGGEDSQGDEAIPYDPSDVQGTKDPMEGVLKAGSQKREMLKPASGSGSGGGGSSKLGLGKLAGSALGSTFGPVGSVIGGTLGSLLPFNEGGVVPRHGYQTAGAVSDLPIDAEIVERAPGLDPNVVSELKREGQRQAAIPQEVKGLASDPTLIRSESGGNWEAENKARGHGGMYGHFGRAQFGHARLQDAMNAGVIPEGTTPQQFMKNQDLQKATEAWHFGDISNFIADKGYDRLIGTKINGIPVTEQGMINAAHLGGKGGLQKYLESGGQYNPNDGRKSLSDYMAMGAGMTGFDRSGQGLGAGRPPQDVGRATETKAAEPGFFEKNKGIILPVLQGIGAMASSKSISPWAAALQGLGAGAKAYGDVEAQQAQIKQTEEGTRTQQATTAQTWLTAAKAAMYTADGKTYVLTKSGPVLFSVYASDPSKWGEPLVGPQARRAIEQIPGATPITPDIYGEGAGADAGAGTGKPAAPAAPGAPAAPAMQEQPINTTAPKFVSGAPTPYTLVGKTALDNIEVDKNRAVGWDPAARATHVQAREEQAKNIRANAVQSAHMAAQFDKLAQYAMSLPESGWSAPGKSLELRKAAADYANELLKTAGSDFRILEKDIGTIEGAQKIQAAVLRGQRSNEELQVAAASIPNLLQSRQGFIASYAPERVRMQKAMDEHRAVEDYRRQYEKKYGKSFPEGWSVENATRAFNDDNPQAQYDKDMERMKWLMSQKDPKTGETYWSAYKANKIPQYYSDRQTGAVGYRRYFQGFGQ